MSAPEDASAVRVAVVDDQTLFRSGIRMLIESQDDMVFCGCAGNGEEAVDLAQNGRPDVMLMDLRMPVLDGVSATTQILRLDDAPGTARPRIIALTTYNQDEAVVRAMQAGASGFILKSAEPEFLLAAIRSVHAGHAVIAPGATQRLFENLQQPAPGPNIEAISALSAREAEVFILAAQGKSNTEIGSSMFVSEGTVKSHIRSILSKLELRTRIQLVAFAYEHRLLG
jgi:DNA-binding NarL/FixJ family response regulator